MPAVYFDLQSKRIPNKWIVLASSINLVLLCLEKEQRGCVLFLVRFLLPIVLLYAVYIIGGLGAGDIKLFAVISTTMEAHQTISVILCSFFIGAAYGLLRWISEKKLFSKIREGIFYGKQYFFYRQKTACIQRLQEGETIHFSLCILCAYIGVLLKEGIW